MPLPQANARILRIALHAQVNPTNCLPHFVPLDSSIQDIPVQFGREPE